MFLDRTFGDLLSFPKRFHPALAPLMQMFTMWSNPENGLNCINSNCYKVIANDPRDEIVSDGCSVKTSIAHQILKDELELQAENRVILAGTNIGLPGPSISISQYFHVLNRSETGVLFKSLE